MASDAHAFTALRDKTPAGNQYQGEERFIAGKTKGLGLCILVFLCALGLNLYRLGSPSIWFDEVLSIFRAQQTEGVLLQIVSHSQPNMALYYFFLHYWLSFLALFGLPPNESVARFPSAVFAAGGAELVFLLGRRFAGTFAGIAAAALYLLDNLQLYYAQDARAYSLQLLLLCISWYAFLSILTAERQRKRWWICYVAISVLAVYAQLFSLFVLAAQFCTFAALLILPGKWRAKTLKQLPALFISSIAFFILVTPILIASRVGAKTGWLPIPHLRDVYHLFLTISDNSQLYLLLLVLCILGSLCIGVILYVPGARNLLNDFSFGILAMEQKAKKAHVTLPVVVALACWVIVPVVTSYIVSQRSDHLFSSRYLVVIVPAFFLLVGLGITLIRLWPVRVIISLCLVAIALLNVPAYYASAQVENWRTASQWLVQHYEPDDGLVCYNNVQGCQLAMNYYLRLETAGKVEFPNDAPGAFPWVVYDETNHIPGNFRAAVDPDALQAYGTKHARIFFTTARVDPEDEPLKVARQWLDTHADFIDQIETPTVTVRLYRT